MKRKSEKVFMKFIILCTAFCLSIPIHAHKGEKHSKKENTPKSTEAESEAKRSIFEKINDDYEKNVKPIFKNKCFDCHSDSTKYPWYYKVPLVKGMIDDDIKESKEHLDMTQGFPFAGHGTPLEDLNALAETVKKGEMPPLRYRMMHWGSGLTAEEVKMVTQWVERSKKLLISNEHQRPNNIDH